MKTLKKTNLRLKMSFRPRTTLMTMAGKMLTQMMSMVNLLACQRKRRKKRKWKHLLNHSSKRWKTMRVMMMKVTQRKVKTKLAISPPLKSGTKRKNPLKREKSSNMMALLISCYIDPRLSGHVCPSIT